MSTVFTDEVQHNYKLDVIAIFLVLIMILCANPLAGVGCSLLLYVKSNDKFGSDCKIWLILTAIWISLINISKTISGDQIAYTYQFLNVPKEGFYNTVFKSWGGSGKEPLYNILVWALYWITGESVRLFYFFLSFVIYYLLFIGVYKTSRAMDAPKIGLVCGIIAITFFTQYFVMTMQLIRQILAGSILVYGIGSKIYDGKNHWLILLSAVLIHTSAFFLAILSIIPWFYSWMSLKKITITLSCFIPLILFNGPIGTALGGSTGISAIDYGLATYGNTGYNDGGGAMSITIMSMIFVPLTLISIVILLRYDKKDLHNEYDAITTDAESESGSISNQESKLLPLCYMFFLTMIFVLMFSKSPLVQYRFFYYSYIFIPFLLPYLFSKQNYMNWYCGFVMTFFIIRFFLTYDTSSWRYASFIDILIQPITFYFTGNFSRFYLL